MKLAKIFSDHIVLQRNKPVCIWGFEADGEVVLTLVRGKQIERYYTNAEADGSFAFTVAPHRGSVKPYTLRVETANGFCEINDVRFGEVILTMGQSNMAYGVSAMVNRDEILAAARTADIAAFDVYEAYQQADGSIFRPSKPEQDFAGDWRWLTGAEPDLDRSSGIAVMVALQLEKALRVPVGIVNTALGGVSIDTYLPREFADEYPQIGEYLKKIDKYIPENGEYNVYGGANYTQLGGIYNEKIAPILRLTVGGILWYQGENAVSDFDGGVYYAQALTALIRHYQTLFGEDVPFLCSHIALDHYPYGPYGYNYINEAIDDATDRFREHVESFAAYDASTQWLKEDGLLYYHPIHPVDKRLIAERYARYLLSWIRGNGQVYPYIGQVLPKDGYLEAVVYPETVRLRDGVVKGFAVAGEDGKFVQAEAEVVGQNRVKVSSPYVKNPKELTYAFAQYNDGCNLKTMQGDAVKPYRVYREDWTARGYFPLNAYADCDVLTGTEKCFGADLGCLNAPEVWLDGKITRTKATRLSIVKGEKKPCLNVRYAPTNQGYYYFGISPEIALAGSETPIDSFRYLTLRMKAESGKKVAFHGVLAREGQNKLHRFVGETWETELTDEWQDYTVSLEKFVEGELGVLDATPQARKNIHTIEFFFRSQTKGKLWIDSVRLHD